MKKVLGIALIVVGAILVYYGLSEGSSPVGELSEALTGSPPERSLMKIVGGLFLMVMGGGAVIFRSK